MGPKQNGRTARKPLRSKWWPKLGTKRQLLQEDASLEGTTRGHYGMMYLNKSTRGAQGILFDPLVGETLMQNNRDWGETTALIIGRAKKGVRLGLGQSEQLNAPHTGLETGIPGFFRKDFLPTTPPAKTGKGRAKGGRAKGTNGVGGEGMDHQSLPPTLPPPVPRETPMVMKARRR